MSGLSEYLKSLGAKPIDPEALAEYERAMRDEAIPAIEADQKAQRRAAHFARLGIPDPCDSGSRSKSRDVKQARAEGRQSGPRRGASPNLQDHTHKESNSHG